MQSPSRLPDQGEHHDRIKRVARAFIDDAVQVLTEERVLPTSIYRRFITVGKDYQGGSLMYLDTFKAFEQILQQSYPVKFADPLTSSDPQVPITYIFSLLEALIARSGSEGTFSSDSEGFEESFIEMITLLDSNKYEITCCREVSHLETVDNLAVDFGDISVIPRVESQNLTIDKFIPGARRAFNGVEPRIYNPPLAFINIRISAESQNPYLLVDSLSAKIDKFILILRLLYSTTAESHWQVTGTSTLVSPMSPVYEQYRKGWLGPALIRRSIQLSAEHKQAIENIQDMLSRSQVTRKGLVINSFDLALERFERTFAHGNPFDKIVDLCTALEAILVGDGDENSGISLRLKTRASALLSTEHDPASRIFDDMTTFYNLRSKIVHGGHINATRLINEIRKISAVPEQGMFGTATSLAVDRLQDLVRRAILARVCLASEPEPLWPFNAQKPIDSLLSDSDTQSQWRNHWHQKMSGIGAYESAGKSLPAIDSLSRDG